MRRPLLTCLRLLLGIIFVAASVDKIIHPGAFAQIIYNYQVLPDKLINLAAILLPWIEVSIGFLLIFGVWLPGATMLINLLLLTFFGTLMFNLARGINVHCGCFSTSASGNPQTVWYVIRDSLFLILGLSLFHQVFLRREMK